jgi:hypothetical protein
MVISCKEQFLLTIDHRKLNQLYIPEKVVVVIILKRYKIKIGGNFNKFKSLSLIQCKISLITLKSKLT